MPDIPEFRSQNRRAVDRRLFVAGAAAAAFGGGAALVGSAESASAAGSLVADATSSDPALLAGSATDQSAVYAQINNAASTAATVNAQTNGHGNAIYGTVANVASNAPAVVGTHNGTGASVSGYAAGTGHGVLGVVANAASSAAGVAGYTIGDGAAIYAESTGSGGGLYARAFGSGPAVRGASPSASSNAGVQGDDGGVGSGFGVLAQLFNAANASAALHAETAGSGPAARLVGSSALDVQGVATFVRSGVALIAHPAKAATVVVPGAPLTSSSLVLAVLRTHHGARWVVSAVPIEGTNDATIMLNRAPGTARAPATAEVAWFVVG